MANAILPKNPSNSTSFNLALKTIMLINNDRKQGIKGVAVATSERKTKNINVVSIVRYLKRVAVPFRTGFAS